MKNTVPFRLLGASVVHCVGAANEEFQRQQWPWCTVEYILQGAGYLQSNGSECWPQAGDVYILHRHSRHRYFPDPEDPWHKVFFCATGRLVDQLWTLYGLDDTYHVHDFHQEELFSEMLAIGKSGAGDADRRAAIVFHRLVSALQSASSPGEPAGAMSPVKEYLDEHVEEELRLDDLCRHAGMSEAHLIRRFRVAYGQSPYDYLLARRVEQARFLLSNSTMRIKEIAARLRFADSSHFSNTFRKRTGVSPKAFREQL